MWDFKILGVTVYYILSYLIIFSFLGWVWESSYVSICQKKLVNRGYVTGPLVTIYGFGAVAIYLLLKPISFNYVLLYFGGLIVATVLEYFTAAVMEALFHTSWWDYTDKKFNYKGRICLGSSIAWGACSILLFAFLIPFANKIISLFSVTVGKVVIIIILCIYSVDYTFATIAAIDVSKQVVKMEKMLDEITDVLKSTKIYSTGEELAQRMSNFKHQVMEIDYKKRYSKRLEVVEAVWDDRISKLKASALNSDTIDNIRNIYYRFENSVNGLKYMQNRILTAYPNMKSKDLFNKDIKNRIKGKNRNKETETEKK